MKLKALRTMSLGWLLCVVQSMAMSGQSIEVSASRLVGDRETMQEVRALLERELRKDALRRSPTIVEWDRDLRGDEYRETVREMAAAKVTLSEVKERVEITEAGKLKVTLSARAEVSDEEMRRWAAGLDETERLRNELGDARRRLQSIASTRSAQGQQSLGAERAGESTTGVRMRLGDAAQLAAEAERAAKERDSDRKEALLRALRSAVVQVGSVRAEKTPGSQWTGFRYEISWKLREFAELSNAYTGAAAFKGPGAVSKMAYFDQFGGSKSAWKAREELMWTRIDLEISSGAGKKLIPVAFPAFSVSMIGEQACVNTYGRDFLVHARQTTDMGWCLLVEGDARGGRGQPDVAGQSTLWVMDKDLASMVGPELSWSVRWKDGTVQRIAPVVQWTGS